MAGFKADSPEHLDFMLERVNTMLNDVTDPMVTPSESKLMDTLKTRTKRYAAVLAGRSIELLTNVDLGKLPDDSVPRVAKAKRDEAIAKQKEAITKQKEAEDKAKRATRELRKYTSGRSRTVTDGDLSRRRRRQEERRERARAKKKKKDRENRRQRDNKPVDAAAPSAGASQKVLSAGASQSAGAYADNTPKGVYPFDSNVDPLTDQDGVSDLDKKWKARVRRRREGRGGGGSPVLNMWHEKPN